MARRSFFPLVGASLFVLWLLLNQTLSLGHIFLASLIAIVGVWSLALLAVPKARMRRPAAVIHLSALVLIDIVRSNIAVARIILGLGGRARRSGFVNIPLDVRDPYAVAALACIITSTPGTLWVSFDETSRTLTIHVLDLIDENEWIRTIKGRYERLLLEIFA
jgi:multicomponent K+:H+ antiporter subunit E